MLINPPGDDYRENGIQFLLTSHERFMIGDHQVMYEIKPKWSLIEYSFRRYVRFDLEIQDCKVFSFTTGPQLFESSEIDLGSTLIMPFTNYIQEPNCEFPIDYETTLLNPFL